jgi:1,2-diacylglycerol 3-alpha-glucosyltransferase
MDQICDGVPSLVGRTSSLGLTGFSRPADACRPFPVQDGVMELFSPSTRSTSRTRPLRVLLTTDWWEPTVNGVVASVTTLRRQLEALGCEVRVLTLSSGLRSHMDRKVYRVGSVSVSLLYNELRVGLPGDRRILRAIRRWGPDVVHSQCEFTTYVWARRIARELDIPIVHTYHTIYEDYTHYYSPSKTVGKKVAASFSRHILDHTDAVIAPTDKVATLLHGYHVRVPVHVAPTGLDLTRFRPARTRAERAEVAELRAQLGIAPDQKVLLSVSRLAEEKNLDTVLEDFAASGRTDTVLVLIGGGPYRDQLIRTVARLGIGSRVRMPGVVDPSDIARWYRIGDVFVSASRSETQGLTYIEALASGLPLLCRRDDSLEDVVVEGRNGYLVEDPEAFATCLDTMLDDPVGLELMSCAAREHARETCDATTFAQRVFEVYRSVCAPHTSGPEGTDPHTHGPGLTGPDAPRSGAPVPGLPAPAPRPVAV